MPLIKSLLLSILLISPPNYAFANSEGLETAGDSIQIALPLAALASSYFLEDNKTPKHLGYKQFLKSFGLGLATVTISKIAFYKKRPSGADGRSFPSGHTFSAFSGAAFINTRFGYKWGLPAYLLAGFTGFSRIHSKAHYIDDVLAGASIAYLFNRFATDKNMPLVIDLNNQGIRVSMNVELDDALKNQTSKKINFTLLLGPNYVSQLNLSSGFHLQEDISQLNNDKNHTFTSKLLLNYKLSQYSQLQFSLSPFQIITSVKPKNSIQIETDTFTSSNVLKFDWIQYDLDSDYLYSLYKTSRFSFGIGAGLALNYSQYNMSPNTNREFSTSQFSVTPNLVTQIKVTLSTKLSTGLKLNWYDDQVTRYLKTRLDLKYRIHPKWSVLTSLQNFHRSLTTPYFSKTTNAVNIRSRVVINNISLGVSYDF